MVGVKLQNKNWKNKLTIPGQSLVFGWGLSQVGKHIFPHKLIVSFLLHVNTVIKISFMKINKIVETLNINYDF